MGESAARMKRLVHGPQVVAVDVRVQLRGGEVRVAEHFLDGAEVGATLEQVGRERVPQGVRRHPLRQPGEPRRTLDDAPRAYARQGRAAGVEKYQPPSLPLVEAGTDLACVQRHGTQRAPTHRHDSLLRALTEDAGEPILV